MTRDQWNVYFSGLFDGEGTVYINKYIYKDPRYNPRFQLTARFNMTDSLPLKVGMEIWGGSLHKIEKRSKNPNWADCYMWQVSSKLAMAFLRDILPYSVIKTEQIVTALTIEEVKKKKALEQRGKWNHWVYSPETIKELDELRLTLSRLKKEKLL